MRFLPVLKRQMVIGAMAGACGLLFAASGQVTDLRKQLAAAEEDKDQPAAIELCHRILESAPRDQEVWETLVRAQIATTDYDRCVTSLDAWEKAAATRRPAIIDELRGDVAAAREQYDSAERYWRAYLAASPKAVDVIDKLADRLELTERWRDALDLRTRALAVADNAQERIARATIYLKFHDWDKALADAERANALDAADSRVKELYPKFESLRRFLPRIKALDQQIAKSLPAPLLDQAQLLMGAGWPDLALKNCEQAMKLAPSMARARIQTGAALLGLNRVDDAAKLKVSHDLVRDKNGLVDDEILKTLGARDTEIAQKPGSAEAFVNRAKTLRRLNQNLLALLDAQMAMNLDPHSAAACFQAAHALDGLGQVKQALAYVQKAAELDPNDPVTWYYRGLLEAGRADFEGAINSQTRSLQLRESYVALAEREKWERQTGRITEADSDAGRLQQLHQP
jgi:tetratricopeptide (TPR) repeat protein